MISGPIHYAWYSPSHELSTSGIHMWFYREGTQEPVRATYVTRYPVDSLIPEKTEIADPFSDSEFQGFIDRVVDTDSWLVLDAQWDMDREVMADLDRIIKETKKTG